MLKAVNYYQFYCRLNRLLIEKSDVKYGLINGLHNVSSKQFASIVGRKLL